MSSFISDFVDFVRKEPSDTAVFKALGTRSYFTDEPKKNIFLEALFLQREDLAKNLFFAFFQKYIREQTVWNVLGRDLIDRFWDEPDIDTKRAVSQTLLNLRSHGHADRKLNSNIFEFFSYNFLSRFLRHSMHRPKNTTAMSVIGKSNLCFFLETHKISSSNPLPEHFRQQLAVLAVDLLREGEPGLYAHAKKIFRGTGFINVYCSHLPKDFLTEHFMELSGRDQAKMMRACKLSRVHLPVFDTEASRKNLSKHLGLLEASAAATKPKKKI